MDEHQIHRLDEFLPHLARLQPHLLELLPAWEQPAPGVALTEWVLDLPQRRLMEICSSWVLETLQHLRRHSPLSNVLLRGCLLLGGEFDLGDAAAVAIGEVPRHGDPRREEVRLALARAARLGLLIHLPADERWCVPFPVRLSFEGVEFLDARERDTLRRRLIRHFGTLADEFVRDGQPPTNRHWRFANMLTAWEMAADMVEDIVCMRPDDWNAASDEPATLPPSLCEPLIYLADALGRAVVLRQTDSVPRLLEAAITAAAALPNPSYASRFLALLGQYHLRRGQHVAAIEAYRRWEQLGRSERNSLWTVLALSAVAMVHRDEGNLHTALTEFLHASAVARSAGLSEQAVDTANCAARLLLADNAWRRAIALLEEALEEADRQSYRFPACAETLALLGAALRGADRPEEARRTLLEADALARTLPHRPAEGEAAFELGMLASAAGNREEAERWLHRSLDLGRELVDPAAMARALIALADTTEERAGGSSGAARDLLARAMRSAQEARRPDLVGAVWHRRGRMALQRSDDQDALACFRNEAQALRETTRGAEIVEAHLRTAGILLRQEAPVAAASALLRAQGVARAARLRPEPPGLGSLLTLVQEHLSEEHFERLVGEVSDELECGLLIKFDKTI